ncbi:SMI1 / KNR4 family (SUKH-1) [Tenacibaculum sp. MAR_2009_124]|uniref:SMI1/KNR4 family protein n=1 Tax=Tenacibaculum sp. MAR_2009_124 TaxID=1250059 RepID=UPI000897DE02|nr:SMI1/KNR4 family protein [Tenacibaculum sp. MAR_2009_124]SEB81685.1 SMI1 / KNR4 family (SUKH-1) [Tenacibaculum sp. MAR_2009_124]
MENINNFWKHPDQYNAELSNELITKFEKKFAYKLPKRYQELLQMSNGGIPIRDNVKTNTHTSWAKDHVAILDIKGIETKENGDINLDASNYWSKQVLGHEATKLLLICDCPSLGSDVVMLDYRDCNSANDEPCIVHMDSQYNAPIKIADNFDDFLNRLYHDYEEE